MILEKSDRVRALLIDVELALGGMATASPLSCRQCAREIVAAVLDVTPGEVSRRIDLPVSAQSRAHALTAALRHAAGEPLAYAMQSAAFRNLVLYVDRRVLIPRPETEIVVDEALKVAAGRPGGIAVDVGTGSGAIALSLATEGKFSHVVATDISRDALDVAECNVARYRARQVASANPNDHARPVQPSRISHFQSSNPQALVTGPSHSQPANTSPLDTSPVDTQPSRAQTFETQSSATGPSAPRFPEHRPSPNTQSLQFALSNKHAMASVELRLGPDLHPLEGIKARVLVSNPPYIAFDEATSLPAAVRDWEPSVALFADHGGMQRYEVLLAGAPAVLEPGGWIVLEVDARRAELTKALAEVDGRYTEIRLVKDLTQRDRVLVARLAC